MVSSYHNPVMLQECLDGLDIDPDGVYVDVTFGGGGHSRAILESLSDKGRVVAFDQDPEAQANALEDPRFLLIAANFSDMQRFLRFHGYKKVNGVLADFGVSSHQFDTADRGFSIRFDGPLDMRMNPGQELNAAQVINAYALEDLRNVFKVYGELKQADRFARAVIDARDAKEIVSTQQLKDVFSAMIPERHQNKVFAQVFQALRIEVNRELEVIKQFLNQVSEVLEPKGRLVVMSYHSLEDRLVKNFIRSGRFQGEVEKDFYGNPLVPFKKVGGVQVASAEEVQLNSRSRSAKLRVAERL